MRGAGVQVRRRVGAVALSGALVALVVVPVVGAPAPARADTTSLPGTMSTGAQNTSSFAVHVPPGVEVRAITAVVTMPEVVAGGNIGFTVNGAVRTVVPSALYQKVRIPVTPADVVADGTIALDVVTAAPAAEGASCLPPGGVASVRKIELDHGGAEIAPTTLADFFPESSAGVTVVIPEDADDDMIRAGLTAVAALAYRYDDDDTPVNLSLNAPGAETAMASQRVVALVAGPDSEVTTAVSTTGGIPMLTLTGGGEELVDAARTLSSDALGLSGSAAENPSLATKPRSTAKSRSLDDLDLDPLTLTGYGSVTQQFELRQDSFGVPVSAIALHLEGTHTAFSSASGARLDVRANGQLIGSAVLGEEATFDLDVKLPAGSIRSVNDLELTLNAVAPDGSACTPPSIPPAEVDVDMGASTVEVEHGTGQTQGFQLFPQIYEGTLPVALRADEGREASAAINAAALISALQRAAGSPLEIQLVSPDTFLADDRSGLIVGALAADSQALDAPLELSSTRLLDREDSVQEITSEEPYAVLESIDRNDRLVLMLGSWAPGDKAAPGELARKVVDAVVGTGWEGLDGDLVIADAASPAFVTASRSLAPHQEEEEEESYAKWFVVVIAVLLLLLALQVVIAIRRDRALTRERDDYDDGPAYVEDDDEPGDYEVDALGDVDDLEVHDYSDVHDTGEHAVVDYEEYDDDAADDADDDAAADDGDDLGDLDDQDADPEADDDWTWDDWGDESEEIGPGRTTTAADTADTADTAPDAPDDAGADGADGADEVAESEIEDESREPAEPEPSEEAEDRDEDRDEPEEPAAPPRRRWSDRVEETRTTGPAEPAEPIEPASTPRPQRTKRGKRRPKG